MPDTFVVAGNALREHLSGPSAKAKYLRLFSSPDNPRTFDTLVEFMAKVSDWTEWDLGELHPDKVVEMFANVRLAVEEIAINPTPDESSETGDSKPKTKSPDGA